MVAPAATWCLKDHSELRFATSCLWQPVPSHSVAFRNNCLWQSVIQVAFGNGYLWQPVITCLTSDRDTETLIQSFWASGPVLDELGYVIRSATTDNTTYRGVPRIKC
jgi:hypothetical protein